MFLSMPFSGVSSLISEMDKEAMILKDKMKIEGTDEEDVHEKLLDSDLIKNPEDFPTRKLKYYNNPSRLSFLLHPYKLIGKPEESPEPIPSLSITDKKDLQDSLDKHHLNTDAEKCGTLKDASDEDRQITKEHTVYTKKPPYLILHVKRFNNSSKKISTPITAPDKLELKADMNISKEAAGDRSSIKYPLKGFIYHQGDSVHSGHYITYMIDHDGNWRKYNNLDKDSYGTIVEKSDEELSDRKKRAYLYLYKDDENRVSTTYLGDSPKKVTPPTKAVRKKLAKAEEELFPL